MSTTNPDATHRQRGFSIVAAIFILVVLAALAGFIVAVTTTQNLSFAQDVQGARAYQAARAGIDYAATRYVASPTSANCGAYSVSLAGTPLAEFSVAITSSAVGSGPGYAFCTFTSRASTTGIAVGSPAYVEREIRAVIQGSP